MAPLDTSSAHLVELYDRAIAEISRLGRCVRDPAYPWKPDAMKLLRRLQAGAAHLAVILDTRTDVERVA